MVSVKDSELKLLEGARLFEETTLAAIYDRYSPELYRYAYRLLGDQDMAEDCVSETFHRFLQAIHKGGGPKSYLRAYLFRVAHNWITDHYRRQAPLEVPLNENLSTTSEANPSEIADTNWEQRRLRAALRLLTPDQRQVVMLRFLEGWSMAEVAKAVGKPVTAVKSLQHRALAALRRILLPEEEVTV